MKSHSWTISNKYCLPDILQQCDTQQFARSSMEIFCDVVFRWMIMCECILHAQIKKMIVCCCCFSIFCHAVHVRVAHELRMWPVISYHRRWLSRCAIFPDMLWIVINCCYHMPLQSEFVFARGLLSYPNLARPRPGILNYYFFFRTCLISWTLITISIVVSDMIRNLLFLLFFHAISVKR